MKVSVVLTLLNEGDGLVDLLDALLAQSWPANEFVIVDGGSKDNTVRVLHDYAARDSRFRVYVEPGVNIARGRNIAIAHATGDVIAVTDGGCHPDRHWLRELLTPMEADPGVGAVGGQFVPVTVGRFEFYSGLMSIPNLSSSSQRGMFYGRSSAFRKRLWERVGGYPEWLYTAEDTLFAIGAGRLAEYRIAYAPDSLLHWRPRPTLRKLAKMFYLYGRGNGRIQHGDLKGTLYWMRYYVLLLLGLGLGFVYPWLWLPTALVAWHLYRTIVRPNLRTVEERAPPAADRYLYVPVIAIARNLSTNLGYLRGWLEYRRDGRFKQQLDNYLKGRQA